MEKQSTAEGTKRKAEHDEEDQDEGRRGTVWFSKRSSERRNRTLCQRFADVEVSEQEVETEGADS